MRLVRAAAGKNIKSAAGCNGKDLQVPIKPGLKKLLLAVLSAFAGFAAFPPFDVSLMAWVSLVPLLYVIERSGAKEAFWYSYLAGVVFFGGVLYWLTIVSVPGFIILVVVLGAFYALFGSAVKMIFRNSMNFLAIPLVWVVLEYIRANLFSGFPWALLGHSQYRNLNIIQVADITGAYGVSFIVAAFNVGCYAWVSGSKRKVLYVMASLLMIICSTSYGIYRLQNTVPGESVKISVVQGNISQDLKWEAVSAGHIIEKYSDLTMRAAMEDPDIIIWPETAYPYLTDESSIRSAEMAEISAKAGIPILAGVVYDEGGSYYNSAALFGKDAGEVRIYRKIHLVPFGEYVPFGRLLAPLRKYIDKPIGDFIPGEKYQLFPVRSERTMEDPGAAIIRRTVFHKLGVMICFEDVFPYVARNFVRKGAGILVNITNDAWFGDTAASRQHLQSSVFRAIENRVPVVRAANTGISCFLDHTGKMISQVSYQGREIFVEGYDTAEIKTTPAKSYYAVYGDIFVYFSGFCLILMLVSERIAQARKKRMYISEGTTEA